MSRASTIIHDDIQRVLNLDVYSLTKVLAFNNMLNIKGISRMKLEDTHSKCQVQIIDNDTYHVLAAYYNL